MNKGFFFDSILIFRLFHNKPYTDHYNWRNRNTIASLGRWISIVRLYDPSGLFGFFPFLLWWRFWYSVVLYNSFIFTGMRKKEK
jgi:hypothetical protein